MDNTVHKVIFDTDPGVDDAMALYFALAHPHIELIGITTVFGNVSVEQATQNAHYLTALSGYSLPVAMGAPCPLAKRPGTPPAFIHGQDGLGNLSTRHAIRPHATASLGAAEFIVNQARAYPGEITLVGVAPQTNLGLALKIEPRLPQLIKEVVLMAGTIYEAGNVSPVAEANVWNDPDAADLVFTAGWPLTMIGLDVTHRVILPALFFEKLAKHHDHLATDTLLHATNFYCHFYESIRPELGHACFGHDVLAFVYLVAPHYFTTHTGRIRVAKEGIANGQTMMDKHGSLTYPQSGWEPHHPLSKAAIDIDVTSAITCIEKTLYGNWLRNPHLL